MTTTWRDTRRLGKIKCSRCNGTGMIEQTAVFGGKSSICKMCGFQALGQTQVHDFEKRGGYCRECSGDFNYGDL